MFWNINTNTYVRRTQWRKMKMNPMIISVINKLAGQEPVVMVADEVQKKEPEEHQQPLDEPVMETHVPVEEPAVVPMTLEEAKLNEQEAEAMPIMDVGTELKPAELTEHRGGEESPSVATAAEGEPKTPAAEAKRAPKPKKARKTKCNTAGHSTQDEQFEWNFMNLSVKKSLKLMERPQ